MLPIELIQLAETELEAVCGGGHSDTNIYASNVGLNIAQPEVGYVGGHGPSNVGNVAQELNQANFSAFFAQGSIITPLSLMRS
jgi:hypothetical protein